VCVGIYYVRGVEFHSLIAAGEKNCVNFLVSNWLKYPDLKKVRVGIRHLLGTLTKLLASNFIHHLQFGSGLKVGELRFCNIDETLENLS